MTGYSKDDFARVGDKRTNEKMQVSKKNLIIISAIGALGVALIVFSFISSGGLF